MQELKARARAAVVKGRLEQAEVLYRQVLTRVPREGVTLHPSVEKLLSEVKPRTVSMEDALDYTI